MHTLVLLIASVALQIFALWLAADFITGIVHWWQDAYGNPTWPILGKYVISPNLRHHEDPRAMLKISYWSRVWTSVVTGILILTIFWLCGWCPWQLIVGIAFASQGNEVHAMGHRTDKENGKFVLFLQKIGVVQRRRTHGWHHKAPYDTNFFVMTEFLNPPFNTIKFWEKTERFLAWCGIKTLRGSSIRNGV